MDIMTDLEQYGPRRVARAPGEELRRKSRFSAAGGGGPWTEDSPSGMGVYPNG
jgi:hypothetical protein